MAGMMRHERCVPSCVAKEALQNWRAATAIIGGDQAERLDKAHETVSHQKQLSTLCVHLQVAMSNNPHTPSAHVYSQRGTERIGKENEIKRHTCDVV